MGLIVIDSGFWTTVQDAGRVGYREWGVPVGGAFDRRSADLANALAGNGPECAVLELTLRGGTFESLGSLGIALAGAPMEASIVGTDRSSAVAADSLSTTMQAGDRLVLGRTLAGARTYLAVQGGLADRRPPGQPLDRAALASGRLPPHRGEPDRHPPARRGRTRSRTPTLPIRIIDGPDARTLVVPAVLEKRTHSASAPGVTGWASGLRVRRSR